LEEIHTLEFIQGRKLSIIYFVRTVELLGAGASLCVSAEVRLVMAGIALSKAGVVRVDWEFV